MDEAGKLGFRRSCGWIHLPAAEAGEVPSLIAALCLLRSPRGPSRLPRHWGPGTGGARAGFDNGPLPALPTTHFMRGMPPKRCFSGRRDLTTALATRRLGSRSNIDGLARVK